MDKYAKAIVAMLVAGLAVVQTSLVDGSITTTEWVAIIVAALAGYGFTWAVPNAQGKDTPK